MSREIKLTSVKSYRTPKYPVKENAAASPELLKAVPYRWAVNPIMGAVLAFTIASGLCSCSGNSDNPGNSANTPRSGNGDVLSLQIPVFEHGSGLGSYGCESVAPPVFLSEEEAAQVIREEALLQGVDFSGSKSIEGKFPSTNLYGDERYKNEFWEGALQLDGYDEKLGVGFEFISGSDVSDWQKTGNIVSTVSDYDMKGTARRMADNIENTALFYDPAADWSEFEFDWSGNSAAEYEEYIEQYTAEQKEKMLEQLRSQVRDFLSWLAGQGVI